MKLWKGRFTKTGAESVDAFNASISFDRRLYRQDIAGSVAHSRMLANQGIISGDEAAEIELALQGILADIQAGKIEFSPAMEDIHMCVESILTERIGAAGKKLHTARSRNDQVAVDLRLYLKEEISGILQLLGGLIRALLAVAKAHQDTVMPGYTHLQRAQPVTLAFHLLAYCQMFLRDAGRFGDGLRRMDALPLGAGALSGVAYATDREFLRRELGFARICENAMDAVSDRDFAIEFLSSASIAMMHLSRFCEELILWSSAEFAFIEMDDAFSTGSSIMPQKKNPDVAELIRGKTGRVYGDLFALLTLMKGLPLAYNKDMQEDKIALFDAVDTLKEVLPVFTDMLLAATVNSQKMENAAKSGFLNATDAADYLAKKGVPFRDCHEIIGRLVLHCISAGKAIEDLSLDELRAFSGQFDADLYDQISVRACIAAKRSSGSTSFADVKKQIESMERQLAAFAPGGLHGHV
ncbi:MAG: argininosuccinate lyase [Clostridiales Family XIII bacterium]|jgi:argininosuccinate lyase|nr:argininosuccinate lyase [Clostridiales Family XIII bacterium]